MRHAALPMLLLVAGVVVVGYLAGFSNESAQVAAAPPLSLEGLLEETLPEAPKDPKDVVKHKVDNGPCYVCHGPYDGEELAIQHAKKEVGCMDCHGKSSEHRDDEDNITPPDKMYAQGDIDKMCGRCHKGHDAAAAAVLARWQERCPVKTDPKTIVCTDCHGKHRMKFRTVWWEKKTGKLVLRKEGQRIKVAPDLTKKKTEAAPKKPAADGPDKPAERRDGEVAPGRPE